MSALPELTARAKIAWKAWTHTFGMTGGLMRHDQGDEAYVAGYVAGFEDAALAARSALTADKSEAEA